MGRKDHPGQVDQACFAPGWLFLGGKNEFGGGIYRCLGSLGGRFRRYFFRRRRLGRSRDGWFLRWRRDFRSRVLGGDLRSGQGREKWLWSLDGRRNFRGWFLDRRCGVERWNGSRHRRRHRLRSGDLREDRARMGRMRLDSRAFIEPKTIGARKSADRVGFSRLWSERSWFDGSYWLVGKNCGTQGRIFQAGRRFFRFRRFGFGRFLNWRLRWRLEGCRWGVGSRRGHGCRRRTEGGSLLARLPGLKKDVRPTHGNWFVLTRL